MFLKFKDLEDEIVSFEYSNEKRKFLLQDAKGNVTCEYNPILELDSKYDPASFKYILLCNEREDYTENDIYQVYVNKVRIGWIFPIQALLSNQHNYAANRFFLRYAYVALWLLLDHINSKDEKEICSDFFLEDYYNDALTILVMDCQNISRLGAFHMEDYTVSLYQHGYSYSGGGNLFSQIEKPDKIIHLKPVAENLRQIEYIHTMFVNAIPKNQEAFAMFHTYYQIVEILIAAVFEDKFKKFVNQLDQNSGSLFDQREELGNMTLEKQRVKWLFSEYVSIPKRECDLLNLQCSKLLQENGKKIAGNMAENLYSVRCLLVHSLYMLNEYSHSLLEDVNKAFIDVILEILLTFKITD